MTVFGKDLLDFNCSGRIKSIFVREPRKTTQHPIFPEIAAGIDEVLKVRGFSISIIFIQKLFEGGQYV
jgi:DNA-binding LacI/PurR family transcriptional regulator